MSDERCLAVYGASGRKKVVTDAAQHAGWSLLGFFDDDLEKSEKGLSYFAEIAISIVGRQLPVKN